MPLDFGQNLLKYKLNMAGLIGQISELQSEIFKIHPFWSYLNFFHHLNPKTLAGVALS